MSKRVPFLRKFLNRLERVDRESVQNYVLQLVDETGRYEQILNHLSEGVLLVGRDGKIRFANHQATLWTGSNLDAELARVFAETLPELKNKTVTEVSVISPTEMNLRVTFVPLENSKDNEVLILLEKRMLKEGEKQRGFEALISLTAGIAHEIGNPLNSIAIHLGLLKRQVKRVPEASREAFEKTIDVLNAETARLDRIIKNFLKAVRKPPLRFRQENLNQITEEAISLMQPMLEERGIQVKLHQDPSLPSFLMDRERIHQVLVNLIKNAMEAMPKGGKLSVRVSHKDPIAILQIKDRGMGIKEEDLPRIFDAYYTTKEGGSGLGLMTVLNHVKEHGGRIDVDSRLGSGTTFTVFLPIRNPALQLPQDKK